MNPLLPVVLLELSKHDRIHKGATVTLLKMNEQVQHIIIQANLKYKEKVDKSYKERINLLVGDLVCLHMRKNWFLRIEAANSYMS